MSKDGIIDLLVVGGGINGTGIARDAAGRGLSVVLCEQNDLASHTSSASTKLIHGGLRYLEYYEFRLVREALIEREVLLEAAPHIIWPLRFILPHSPEQRPAWMIRLGLFLYDHLGGRKKLPGRSSSVDMSTDPASGPLKDDVKKAFSYADCWVEDSRLVVLNAKDAAERGAEILTRTRCTEARRMNGLWQVTLASNRGAPVRKITRTCPGQCRRPLGIELHQGPAAAAKRCQRPPGQGQPYRRQEALRSRQPLHLSKRRQPDRVRHPL